ncbi:hypothetical protein [Phenylobacterium sp. SCN 70-31]|uniref:hypothetical protein n=1 Tax=Phenylobacterium sp. SCN 70-31 TaxID=1660129 RepID=UPI00086EEC14|nr:hypothetical protein [Phenylobacterium sp. SCN 70-31]ODT84480.1 MAG: hypothetical protein ABS78_22630 [Phenylobacterium sp. SCN 70-31]
MRVGTIFAAIAAAFAGLVGPAQAESFHFVALGDTAYTLPRDLPTYDALIARINKAKPAFSIHVGDTWGAMPCTEDSHRYALGQFAKFDHPLVYTPGDNEWTDCRKPEIIEAYLRYLEGKATPQDLGLLAPAQTFEGAFSSYGYADPVAGLRLIRKLYFKEPRSLGARTMPLLRQTDVAPAFETAENTRWDKGGVVFATLSVPGSANGFTLNDETRAREAVARNRANVDWIKAAFAEAKAKDAKAVVLALQAGMFVEGRGGDFTGKAIRGGDDGPFYWIVYAIREEAAKFGKPVLLINGDFHDLVIDRPFMVSQGEEKPPRYANINRLQVYGAPELKAVQVNVDTETPWVFSFQPLYN